ncbi:hypothetical protein [Azomonas macrocytogenes]|uniref:YqjK-like protein n=1 Tax=Azomonas macrocytogenes TaxID=69962 RepID=A0A839SX22_AZOMA|nr:hypothetical protein [Azomonas macrocytogenes]MBB3101662.1 hypothetical protein [Azomonas macrocytogenes]
MNQPSNSASDRAARKELVRLRLEMQRQQLRYNAQPLANPLNQVKNLWARRQANTHASKGPLVIATTVVLALFGRRLGKIGTLARIGLTLYPFFKGQQKLRQKLH